MTDQTPPPDEHQTPPTAAEIAAAANLDISTLLIQSLISGFWNPTPYGITHEMQPAPNGMGMVSMPRMNYLPSPLESLATKLFQAHGSQIIEKVLSEVDIEAIAGRVAETVAADVYDRLAKEPKDTYGARDRLTPTAQRVRTLVETKVAEKLSDQIKADYEAQQEAMLVAWHEKMERDRNRGQLYGGKPAVDV